MEAYDLLSCSPSTQVMKNSQELEGTNAIEDVGLKSRERQVCGIAFEGYLSIWMKIATTNPELLMGNENSDEFINCRDRCAVGSNGNKTDHLVQAQRNIPVQKLPKKHTKAKRTRVERMRRLYTQRKAPDPLTPQTPGPALGPDEQEHWEREMDELLEWTHSLSLKELDDLLYAQI
ncbi:hypothetical protein G5714_001409 [Onychostoma macrolepis]|uniref:Uncharacterized protein n=1 Tax=Onychostoma macrolepis TaxID=369639 RepID=A0A7J6DC16_9TELE|nr:hypothetical protein G5714_001409 [Onychostoma macrolepis]